MSDQGPPDDSTEPAPEPEPGDAVEPTSAGIEAAEPATGDVETAGADSDHEGSLEPTAVEVARAQAEEMLRGPALVLPEPSRSPADLEASWSPAVRDALDALRADLEGRRLGLALSGGGSLGSFEVGALRFLYDHLAIEPIAICGNSAGALNAAKLAEGDHDGERAIDVLERLWRAMRTNTDMWEPEPWLVRLQASATWASSIRGHLSETSSAANTVRMAARVVGGLVRRPPETDGTFDAVRGALRAQALLSLDPIARIIEREFAPERLAASGIALRVGTVSLESGKLRYVTEAGRLHDRHDKPLDHPPVSLADGVLASASIPVAFPPVRIGDEHYVDGGAREILPLQILTEHLDVERVIAVSAGSLELEPSGSFAERNLLDIMRRVSAEIGPNETLRKELSPPRGWGDRVRLVVPQFDVHDSMTIDPALIAISIDHGWLRTADVLLDLDESCRALTAELTETRASLRRLAGSLPSLFGNDATGQEEPPSEDRATLTERLRTQLAARRDAGGPLPATLAAWLDAPPEPSRPELGIHEIPVGGAALAAERD